MPFVDYDASVNAIVQMLYELDVIVVFPWMQWHSGERLFDANAAVSPTCADTARWLTAVVRSERFGDGAIASRLDNGSFIAALRRLLECHATEPA